MTTIVSFAAVVAMFLLVLGLEARQLGSLRSMRPLGLLAWLTTGNWPAKVGACLLILGLGALMRYALIQFELPPEIKLGAGFLVAAGLGAAAAALRTRPERRAVHLGLAGAAFGTAYLTAYAAYNVFHFISSVNALSLLVLVSVGAGVFSVSSNAMSVAVLAMLGAYVAPRFAIESPGPLPVYGYYVAVSALCLVMVAARGWRPLIHLSLLFTLIGGVFFGWLGKFHQAEHHAVMLPMLLLLCAIHLAMPLVERRGLAGRMTVRMDQGYFVVLPIVAAFLMLKIAPRLAVEGAMGLGLLALLWAAAAAVLAVTGRGQAVQHGFVAALLAAAAGLSMVQQAPWLLVGMAMALAALAAAPRLEWPRRVQVMLCHSMLLLGLLHMVTSIMHPVPERPFLNDVFMERFLVGVMLAVAAWLAKLRAIDTARLLGVFTVVWLALATVAELLRLQLDYAAQIFYGLMLALLAAQAVAARRYSFSPTPGTLLLVALVLSCEWAAQGAHWLPAGVMLALTAAVMAAVVAGNGPSEPAGQSSVMTSIALAALPMLLYPWAFSIGTDLQGPGRFIAVSGAVAGLYVALFSARVWVRLDRHWNQLIWPAHFLGASGALLFLTLFHIERGFWPIAVESLLLLYLALTVALHPDPRRVKTAGVVMVVAAALTIQAMLLRLWGPDRVMNAGDILGMSLPAVVSLMWAGLGAGLAWWATRSKSRSLWSAGAVLMALAALKITFRDFGSMDQLGNILALIGSGVVFMAVAWFAPIPKESTAPDDPSAAGGDFSPTQPGAAPEMESDARHVTASVSDAASVVTPGGSRSSVARPTARQGGANWLIVMIVALVISAIAIATEWGSFNKRQEQRRLEIQRLSPALVEDARTESRNAVPEPQVQVQAQAQPQAQPQTQPQTQPQALPQTSSLPPIRVTNACTNFSNRVPKDAVIYAGGAYSGRKLGYQIDQSGHEATVFDVFVHNPGRNVVLALGAYEPSVWNIRWSPGTVVAAVLVSGYHRQAIAGVDDNVPKLESSYDNRGACGYFYFDSANPHQADSMVRTMFGRSADTYYLASNGRIDLGLPGLPEAQYVQSSANPMASFRDKGALAAGQAGIEQLLRDGSLRRATPEDQVAWRQAWAKARNLPQIDVAGSPPGTGSIGWRAERTYVVLKPMTFPAGLFGAHMVTFIIAPGVVRPEGNPGHSQVLDMNAP